MTKQSDIEEIEKLVKQAMAYPTEDTQVAAVHRDIMYKFWNEQAEYYTGKLLREESLNHGEQFLLVSMMAMIADAVAFLLADHVQRKQGSA